MAAPSSMRPAAAAALVLAVLLAAAPQARAQQDAPAHQVSTPAELRDALNDGTLGVIQILDHMILPAGFNATVTRTVLITSPSRTQIDWCDAACKAGKISKDGYPLIRVLPGGSITFMTLFFRNTLPSANIAKAGQTPGEVLAATVGKESAAASPVPLGIRNEGGQVTYKLTTFHFLPGTFWSFDDPSTFWGAASAASAIRMLGSGEGISTTVPEVYLVKLFTNDKGATTMSDCYFPVDVNKCLPEDAPFTTTLDYCPYSLKDSLLNPTVEKALIFHDIYLDRWAWNFHRPATINKTMELISCPGTRQTLALEGVSRAMKVQTGGEVNWIDIDFMGSRNVSRTDWPSNNPMLLSPFDVLGNGNMRFFNCTFEVTSPAAVAATLDALPSFSSAAPDTPTLAPVYSVPPNGDNPFVIESWKLFAHQWALYKGNKAALSPSFAQGDWCFFNVTVTQKPFDQHCFAGAQLQGSASDPDIPQVSTGPELLAQLGNASARYIQVTGDITIDSTMTPVAVDRFVEVRACHPEGGHYLLDWGNTDAMVTVSAEASFQDHLRVTGLGWGQQGDSLAVPVTAFAFKGTGMLTFENVELEAQVSEGTWNADQGVAAIKGLLQVSDLSELVPNATRIDPNTIMFTRFDLVREQSSGANGELQPAQHVSFVDCTLTWTEATEGGSSVPLAAIVVPAVIGGLLLAAAVVFGFVLFRRKRARALGKLPTKDGAEPTRTNSFIKLWGWGAGDVARQSDSAFGSSDDHKGGGLPSSKGTGGSPFALVTGSDMERGISSSDRPRSNSGPTADIENARKFLMVMSTTGSGPSGAAGSYDSSTLVLESLLGEGSYGKVYKGTWKGTVVAVKVMILPSHMSGGERREKMLVMETAISSSLSHPNIVQTYTYAVEPIKSQSTLASSKASDDGGGSLHDSTKSLTVGAAAAAAVSTDDVHSWEVKLVQEFADRGTLRDGLTSSLFSTPAGAMDLAAMLDTALDIARAMAHLHSQAIIHADLKARNVLLKSARPEDSNGRGFVAKVADFGLSIRMDPNATHISNAFQGTMTHMAPETLMSGHVSKSSDVYAFGILLWELLTGDRAYRGVPRALLGHSVARQGLRPTFPPGAPFDYQLLACRCWETDVAIRPTFEELLGELSRMRSKYGAPAGAADITPASSSGSLRGLGSSHNMAPQTAAILAAANAGGSGSWTAPSSSSSGRVSSVTPAGLPAIADVEDEQDEEAAKQAWQANSEAPAGTQRRAYIIGGPGDEPQDGMSTASSGVTLEYSTDEDDHEDNDSMEAWAQGNTAAPDAARQLLAAAATASGAAAGAEENTFTLHSMTIEQVDPASKTI